MSGTTRESGVPAARTCWPGRAARPGVVAARAGQRGGWRPWCRRPGPGCAPACGRGRDAYSLEYDAHTVVPSPHTRGVRAQQGVDKAGGGPAQPLLVDEAPAHLEQAGSRAGCSRPLARHRRLEVGRARRLRLAVHWPPCRVRGLRHATRRGSRRRRTGPRRPGDIADAVAGVLRRGLGPVLQDADHDGDARGVPGERLNADRMRQQDQPIDRGAGDLPPARQAEGGHERGPHGERVAARPSRRRRGDAEAVPPHQLLRDADEEVGRQGRLAQALQRGQPRGTRCRGRAAPRRP